MVAQAVAPVVGTPKAKNLVFLRASQVQDVWGLNFLVYGPPGSGKTTLAASAQDSEYGRDVLFIDVEGGVRSIADRNDITVFRPDTFEDIREVYAGLQSGAYPFKTVIVDSIGEAQALGLRSIMRFSKTPDLPGLQDYGKSNEQIVGLIRGLRGLSQSKGINVIFTALAAETKDETTGAVLTRPALTPKALELATGAVDMLGFLNFDPRKNKRVLKFQSNGTFLAKIRQPATGDQIPGEIENPSLVEILAMLRTTRSSLKGEEIPAT